MKAANFVAKYSTANKSKAVVPYDKIKATEKWVEYSLDIVDMNRILMSVFPSSGWHFGIWKKTEPHVITERLVGPEVDYVPNVGGDADLGTAHLRLGEDLHVMNSDGPTLVHTLGTASII